MVNIDGLETEVVEKIRVFNVVGAQIREIEPAYEKN